MIVSMLTAYMFFMLISVIPPNRQPSPGQIGAFYFETADETQVWIDIEPLNAEPGPNPVKLNFTVSFPGREIDHSTDSIQIRAISYDSVFPLMARQPILKFIPPNDDEMDLTAQGKDFQFIYNGMCKVDESCVANTVIARTPFSDLSRIASSRSLKVEAVGFRLKMQPKDLNCLRNFLKTVQDGIRLAPVRYGRLE